MEPNTILALVLVALILAGLAFLYMCRPLTFLSGVHGEAAAGQNRRFLLY